MATLRETGEIANTAELDDALGLLTDFYRENGYALEPVDSSEDSARTTRLVRGRRWNSWWSSNMTELHTHLTLQEHPDHITLEYSVEVSGQILTDIERSFWLRESQAAERYLRDPSGPIPDLRITETDRADKTSNRYISFGIWGAVIVFFAIIILGFVGII